MMHCKLKSSWFSAIAFFAVGYKFQSPNDDWIEGNGKHNSNSGKSWTNITTDYDLSFVTASGSCSKGSPFTFFPLI